MIDRTALLRDLKPQLRLLEDDLRRRSAEVPEFDETLHLEWEDAKQSNRTAAGYDTWLDDRVTQAGGGLDPRHRLYPLLRRQRPHRPACSVWSWRPAWP